MITIFYNNKKKIQIKIFYNKIQIFKNLNKKYSLNKIIKNNILITVKLMIKKLNIITNQMKYNKNKIYL